MMIKWKILIIFLIIISFILVGLNTISGVDEDYNQPSFIEPTEEIEENEYSICNKEYTGVKPVPWHNIRSEKCVVVNGESSNRTICMKDTL